MSAAKMDPHSMWYKTYLCSKVVVAVGTDAQQSPVTEQSACDPAILPWVGIKLETQMIR